MATSISLHAEGRWPAGRRLSALALVGALALTGSLFALSRSAAFRIRTLEVEGLATLAEGRIATLAGLTEDTNVLWLDETGAVRALEDDPWIAEARVTTRLPWTVSIEVVERTPVAVAQDAGGSLLVAEDGTVLGRSTGGRGLPLIVVPPASALDGRAPGFRAPARAIAALNARLPVDVREAVLAVDGSVTLTLEGGVTVQLGAPTDLDRKAIAVKRVLRWAGSVGEVVRSVAVVSADAPAVTFAD